MAKKHDELVEKAKDAIIEVFSDQSVPRSTTKESLEELRDEIEVRLEGLRISDPRA